MFVYLDNSSTTKQYREVTDTVVRYMSEDFGNPSSLHHLGITAEKAMKNARNQVAAAIGVGDNEVIFTSCGTEADNTAIRGAAYAGRRRGKKIITSRIEHPAVLETFKSLEEEGFIPVYIDVDKEGMINMEQLESEIDDETILISLMHVNNELGTIEPVEEAAALKGEALFHTDAVQSFGKLEIPTKNVDMISVSGHKIHGPKGTGALAVKSNVHIKPFIVGGGQEKNMRSGTENTPCIAGFGVAAEMTHSHRSANITHMDEVRDYLMRGIIDGIDDVRINSPKEHYCASVLNVSFLGTRGEVILHTLEQSDIYVSTGSACSSNKKNSKSHVLTAAGLSDEEIEGAIRFSFSDLNTIEEMDYVLDRLKDAVGSFRRLGSFR
ncbi:MAG: cysteine desulfurase [Eubacteriaceae bacterium]|jgi:cysteine desulfurase|nr:cysteine desulfurase [Eubacteriaceae bacterium]